MELCVSAKNQVLFDAQDLPYKPPKSAGELLGVWCFLGPDLLQQLISCSARDWIWK